MEKFNYEKFKLALAKISAENEGKTLEEALTELEDGLLKTNIDDLVDRDECDVTINKDIKCKTCKYGVLLNPYDTWCTEYDLKPTEVLYGGYDCPKYIETKFRSIVDTLNNEDK